MVDTTIDALSGGRLLLHIHSSPPGRSARHHASYSTSGTGAKVAPPSVERCRPIDGVVASTSVPPARTTTDVMRFCRSRTLVHVGVVAVQKSGDR